MNTEETWGAVTVCNRKVETRCSLDKGHEGGCVNDYVGALLTALEAERARSAALAAGLEEAIEYLDALGGNGGYRREERLRLHALLAGTPAEPWEYLGEADATCAHGAREGHCVQCRMDRALQYSVF